MREVDGLEEIITGFKLLAMMGAGWGSTFQLIRKGLGKSECTYDEETEETGAGDEKLLVHMSTLAEL